MNRLCFSLLFLCGLFGQTSLQRDLDIRTYAFVRVVGSGQNSAAGDLSSSGAGKVLTLKPCPSGMVAVPYPGAQYYVYIDGGSGTGEAALVTSVKGTGGSASCTITVTTANTHSGQYRVQSATAGIQEAVNVRPNSEAVVIALPPLTQPADQYYRIYAPVFVPTVARSGSQKKIIFRGSNAWGSRFLIPVEFPLSAAGVFIFEPCDGCLAAVFEDINFSLSHPDSCRTSIAACVQYPPLFMADGTHGLELKNLLIQDAWKIVSMKGTWAGSAWNPRVGWLKVVDVRASAYNVGFDLDGILDTTQFVRLHFWPHGIGGGATSPFYANTQFAIKVGRADGFQVDHSLFINKRAIQFNVGPDGGATFGSITASQFDTYANIEVNAGEIQISNSYSTLAADCDAPAFTYRNGRLMISNHWFLSGGCVQPFVDMQTVAAGGAAVVITGGTMNHISGSGASTLPSIRNHVVSGAPVNLIVSGVYVYRDPNVTWVFPVFDCDSANQTCTFVGNSIMPMLGGSGTFIRIVSDSWHTLRGNTFIGWGAGLPAVRNVGKYEDGSFLLDVLYSGPASCVGQPTGKVWIDVADGRTLKQCP